MSKKPNAVRRALSAESANPNVVGSQWNDPLFIVSQDGRAEIVSMLLAAKADPAQACFGGATPLYIACSRNHEDVAKLLVKAGAPVDALANGYFTPLLACVSHGCEDAARALLAAGADVHLRRPSGAPICTPRPSMARLRWCACCLASMRISTFWMRMASRL